MAHFQIGDEVWFYFNVWPDMDMQQLAKGLIIDINGDSKFRVIEMPIYIDDGTRVTIELPEDELYRSKQSALTEFIKRLQEKKNEK